MRGAAVYIHTWGCPTELRAVPQGDFGLTYFQDGLLPAAFMVGLLVTSPIFAEMSKHWTAFKLLGIGMAVWSLSCLGCAASPHFSVLLVCRALVGVGEASFVALAAPFIGRVGGGARYTVLLLQQRL